MAGPKIRFTFAYPNLYYDSMVGIHCSHLKTRICVTSFNSCRTFMEKPREYSWVKNCSGSNRRYYSQKNDEAKSKQAFITNNLYFYAFLIFHINFPASHSFVVLAIKSVIAFYIFVWIEDEFVCIVSNWKCIQLIYFCNIEKHRMNAEYSKWNAKGI